MDSFEQVLDQLFFSENKNEEFEQGHFLEKNLALITSLCHKTFGVQMGFIDDNYVKPCRNRWIVYVREFDESVINYVPKTGKYEHVKKITHWMPLPKPPKDDTL
jgi:hypothetical protein